MKKILCMIGIIGVLFLTGCGKTYDYTNLNYSQLQTKLDNKDSFVLVIGSSTCTACAQYKKTMQTIMKEKGIQIYNIYLDTLSKEDYAKIYSKYVIEYTPTTIFIKDGLETSTYDRLSGAQSYSDVVENLKKHGFIGE